LLSYRDDIAFALCKPLPHSFNLGLNAGKQSSFVTKRSRRMKAKQQLRAALRAWMLRQQQDA
jgi:hypothetical protein